MYINVTRETLQLLWDLELQPDGRAPLPSGPIDQRRQFRQQLWRIRRARGNVGTGKGPRGLSMVEPRRVGFLI